MRMLVVVVAVAASVGCGPAPLQGAPKLGSSCDSTARWECYTDASIAFCDGGKWAEYPCANRCSNAQSPKCELEKPSDGAACPVAWDGTGMCGAAADVYMLCSGGRWKACECRACSDTGLLYCENRFNC